MRRTPFSTSAVPPTTSPAPTRPGTGWPVSWSAIYRLDKQKLPLRPEGQRGSSGGGFGRALQLDGIAVGIGDVDRRAVAFRAVAPADLARVNTLPLQMRGQGRDVHLFDAHREVIHVAAVVLV